MSDEPLTEQELDDLEARGARCASAKLPGPLHRRLVAQARRAAALAAEHAALREGLREAVQACKTFHTLAGVTHLGEPGWDIYERNAPEMQRWKRLLAAGEEEK